MRVEVSEQPLTALEEYASVPIAFEVSMVLDVAEQGKGRGEFILTERSLDLPYVKHYDAIDGEQPHQWARRFDVSACPRPLLPRSFELVGEWDE